MRVFVLIVLAALVVAVGFGYVRLTQASAIESHKVYVVMAGDTLWDIALRHAPVSVDIRDYVFRLRRVNGMAQSAMIHPGQQLRLPMVR